MNLMDSGSLLTDGLPEESPWAIHGAVGGLTVLWGASGSYKSFVAISIALAVASGRPWFGRPVRQGKVVYVVGEGGWSMFANRQLTAAKAAGIEIDDLVGQFWVTGGPVDLSSPEKASILWPEWDNVQPSLVVVDTVSRCLPGDENKQEVMQGFVAALDVLRERYRATVVAVHHANRGGKFRGSTVLDAAADVVIQAKKTTDGFNRCCHLKADKLKELDTDGWEPKMVFPEVRDVREPDGTLKLDNFGDKVTTLVLTEAKAKERDATAFSTIRALVAARAQGQAVGFREWLEASGQSPTTFKRAVLALMAEGSVVQVARGQYMLAGGGLLKPGSNYDTEPAEVERQKAAEAERARIAAEIEQRLLDGDWVEVTG